MRRSMVGAATSAKRARRSWAIDETRAIIDAPKHSGDPVKAAARRHGMNAEHLFSGPQRDGDGTLGRRAANGEARGPLAFVGAGVIGGRASGCGAPAPEMELPCGATVKVVAGTDMGGLGPILTAARAAS